MANLRVISKSSGLKALNGSWFKAFAIVLIIGLLNFGISKLEDAYRNVFAIPQLNDNGMINLSIYSFAISIVFTLIAFLVITPLMLGMTEWFWRLTAGEKPEVGDIFAWFGSAKLYVKSIILRINVGVRALLWFLLTCSIPLALIIAAGYYVKDIDVTKITTFSMTDIQNLFISGVLMLLGIMLLICGLILFLFLISRYFLAAFLVVEDGERKISDAVRMSIKFTKSYRWEITKFLLSFTGWFITCVAIIPYFYVVPYFYSSFAIFSKHIIYEQRNIQAQSSLQQ